MTAFRTISRALRAYPAMLHVGFADAVAYRAEMVVWMLATTMPLVSLALWSTVAGDGAVGSFTSRGFTAYFSATFAVRQLTGTHLIWEMNQDIRTGGLARRLLKPMHPLVVYSAEALGAMPMRALFAFPVAVLTFFVTEPGAAPRTPIVALLFVLSLFGAWLINFFVMAVIGSLAFFLESSTSVFELWLVAFMVLSGYLFPLELFPPTVRAIANSLPFRYTISFPVEIAIGKLDLGETLTQFAIQWAYVVATALLAGAVWRAGMKRYSAFGG